MQRATEHTPFITPHPSTATLNPLFFSIPLFTLNVCIYGSMCMVLHACAHTCRWARSSHFSSLLCYSLFVHSLDLHLPLLFILVPISISNALFLVHEPFSYGGRLDEESIVCVLNSGIFFMMFLYQGHLGWEEKWAVETIKMTAQYISI